ncbi:MAG TPA: hypothetical protein VFG89_04680 [Coriobacteriia bacterium]|nr:hypothetical protein [Coriobacteriia bacterium]
MQNNTRNTLERTLAQLRRRSLEAGEVPADVVSCAVAATRCALREAPALGLERRAESYYRGVIRRKLVRRGGDSTHAARLVVDSVVEDLIRSGRSTTDAWDEVSRGWAHLLTPELSREFHDRLCA